MGSAKEKHREEPWEDYTSEFNNVGVGVEDQQWLAEKVYDIVKAVPGRDPQLIAKDILESALSPGFLKYKEDSENGVADFARLLSFGIGKIKQGLEVGNTGSVKEVFESIALQNLSAEFAKEAGAKNSFKGFLEFLKKSGNKEAQKFLDLLSSDKKNELLATDFFKEKRGAEFEQSSQYKKYLEQKDRNTKHEWFGKGWKKFFERSDKEIASKKSMKTVKEALAKAKEIKTAGGIFLKSFKPTESGVSQEFAELFEIDFKEANDRFLQNIEEGNIDISEALKLKEKVSETIKEEHDKYEEGKKVLADPKNIEQSIAHLIKTEEDPSKVDENQVFRMLEDKRFVGKDFKNPKLKAFMLGEVQAYRMNIISEYNREVDQSRNEARNEFTKILGEVPKKGFASHADYVNFLKQQVDSKMSVFLTRPPLKLPNSEWDNIRDNFMIPQANIHWEKHQEAGNKKTWELLDAKLGEAKQKDFKTKEELVAFMRESTEKCNKEKLVTDEYWNQSIKDSLSGKVDLLWLGATQESNEKSEKIGSVMKSLKLTHEDLRSVELKTESDFFEFGKNKLKEKGLEGLIPDLEWNNHMMAEFYPNIKAQLKSNEKVVSGVMDGAKLLNSKAASECVSEPDYFKKLKEQFAQTKGKSVFGLIPNARYNQLRDSHLVLRARQGWLEHKNEGNKILDKARGMLDGKYLTQTVHHFSKSKGIANPSTIAYKKSSQNALKSALGLTDQQLKELSPDLSIYAQRAKVEHSQRRSTALSEIRNYTSKLSKDASFSPEELNVPIDKTNPSSSPFYQKLVGKIGYMNFAHVDDWYLVQNEALSGIDNLRKNLWIKFKTETVANDNEQNIEGKTETVAKAMRSVQFDLAAFHGAKTIKDFEKIAKKSTSEQLSSVHGLVSDQEWDHLRDQEFSKQIDVLLNQNEKMVIQSMESFSLPELSSGEEIGGYLERVKDTFGESGGKDVFGLVPDEIYDRLRNKHLFNRAKKQFSEPKKHKEAQSDEESVFEKNVPSWAGRWGLDGGGETTKDLNPKGLERLQILMQGPEYGFSSLDSSYTKQFGPLMVNLLGGMGKERYFQSFRENLKESGVGGMSKNPKLQFLTVMKSLLRIGYKGYEKTLSKVGNRTGINQTTNFNTFFGVSMEGLMNADFEDESTQVGVLEKMQVYHDHQNLISIEDTEHGEGLIDMPNLTKSEVATTAQTTQGQSAQDDEDIEIEQAAAQLSESLKDTSTIESPQNLEVESVFAKNPKEMQAQQEVLTNKQEDNGASDEEENETEKESTEAETEENEEVESIEDEETQEEDAGPLDLEKSIDDENLEAEETEQVDDSEPEETNLVIEEKLEEIADPVNFEEEDEVKEIEDENDLLFEESAEEDIETEEETLQEVLAEDSKAEEIIEKEVIQKKVEDHAHEEFQHIEAQKSERKKEIEEQELLLEQELLVKVDNRSIDKEADLEEENSTQSSGTKSFFGWGKPELEKNEVLQKKIEQKLKLQKLSQNLSQSKSLALLSEEDLATLFNHAHEIHVTEDDGKMTIYQIISFVIMILEMQRGGFSIELELGVADKYLEKRIKNSAQVIDRMVKQLNSRGLKKVTIRGIEQGQILGVVEYKWSKKQFRTVL